MLEVIASTLIFIVYMLSIIRSIISIIGVIVNVYDRVWRDDPILFNGGTPLPRILVILPMYKESEADIKATLNSVYNQDYPRDLMRIVIVVEQDDEKTLDNIAKIVNRLHESYRDIISVLIKPRTRKNKAAAVNYVLKHVVFGDVVAIYDGGDIVLDKKQFLKAVMKFNEGYDVIGSRVFRVGKGVIGRLVFFDTLIWIKIGLPSLAKILGTPIVSGEGLFLKRSFIEKIGGLPEVLTEDAFLTIYAEKYGAKIYLLPSNVYEASPANILSLVKQRLRWYRGHIECLLFVLKEKGIKLTSRVKLLITYSNPLLIASIAIAYIYMFYSILTSTYTIISLLSFLIILSTLTAPIYILPDVQRDQWKKLFLLPTYWLFLGVIAFIALTLPIRVDWYRTERRQYAGLEP